MTAGELIRWLEQWEPDTEIEGHVLSEGIACEITVFSSERDWDSIEIDIKDDDGV